ncbi:MAG TPA: amidohydrolase family protein [Candidatus Limnocylindria bacterium]|jgi:L-fuconolactonase|nr:amidohydrolase family protein [Candidatus Limnocylindria bacterium]
MTVVDAHHHFWDPSRAAYPWMTDELAPIRRRFSPEDLQPLLAANGVERTVLVQTISSEEETREFLATAARHEFIAGVVGWVDLTAPDVPERIAALRAASGGVKLVGIRHQVHDEPDAEWLNRPDVRRGIAAVGHAGLAYDLLVRTRELPATHSLVRAMPDMRFVVDHIAKPAIATGGIDEWSEHMAPLDALPHVFCKLSGMVTEAGKGWRVAALVPYVRHALEWFGPERCMFGSDWPVSLLVASYAQVLSACREAVGDVSAAERERIFGGTASDFYRLAVRAPAVQGS